MIIAIALGIVVAYLILLGIYAAVALVISTVVGVFYFVAAAIDTVVQIIIGIIRFFGWSVRVWNSVEPKVPTPLPYCEDWERERKFREGVEIERSFSRANGYDY